MSEDKSPPTPPRSVVDADSPSRGVVMFGEALHVTHDAPLHRPQSRKGMKGGSGDGKAPRPADLLPVELWYGILRAVLADLIVTISILASLQVLHLVVNAMSLPQWFKEAFHKIHEYSSLIVIALLATGFILRVIGRTLEEVGISNRPDRDSHEPRKTP